MSNILKSELQNLSIDEEVTMFELSRFNPENPNETFYFSNTVGVSFNGIEYVPIACEVTGISYTSEGALPRPKLTISDASPENTLLISAMIDLYGGLEGSRITIRRTLRKFLDHYPTRNGTAEKPKDVFVISQRVQEIPGKLIEFELAASIDFTDEIIGRPAINSCPWIYRSAECGYTGNRYFTITNRRTTDRTKDVCSKTVDGCQRRFGKNAPLPFGGFPN